MAGFGSFAGLDVLSMDDESDFTDAQDEMIRDRKLRRAAAESKAAPETAEQSKKRTLTDEQRKRATLSERESTETAALSSAANAQFADAVVMAGGVLAFGVVVATVIRVATR